MALPGDQNSQVRYQKTNTRNLNSKKLTIALQNAFKNHYFSSNLTKTTYMSNYFNTQVSIK